MASGLSGVLNADVGTTYTGATTETARVSVDNINNVISADVLKIPYEGKTTSSIIVTIDHTEKEISAVIDENYVAKKANLDAEINRAELAESELAGDISALQSGKVDKIAGSSLVPDTKVAGYDSHLLNTSNPHNVTKTQVGLGNVDNTADLNKPVSTATQAALDLKVDKETGKALVETSKVSAYDAHLINTSNPHLVTKAQVGLGSVINAGLDTTVTASSTNYITSGAVKTYVDTEIATRVPLPELPNADGSYLLRVTRSNGNYTYNWIADNFARY